METTITLGLLILAVLLAYSGTRIVADKLDRPDPQPSAEAWPQVTAEVISVLHVGNRHFVMVSYRVGREIFRNDVMRAITGTAPAVGEHVAVRYDPAAPARVELLEPDGPAPAQPRITRPQVSSY